MQVRYARSGTEQTGRVRQQGTGDPRDARQDEPGRDAQRVIQQAQYTALVVPWKFGVGRHGKSCREAADRL
jgi:hypothetical protein